MPTRIAVGAEDYARPLRMARALHGGIMNSSLAVIEGARHLTQLGVPGRVLAGLHPLLESPAAR